jgi:hypothetical protein
MIILDSDYPVFISDPEHGKEIIEVLETLGGFNKYKWNGNGNCGYYGVKDGIINYISNESCHYLDKERAVNIQEFLNFN